MQINTIQMESIQERKQMSKTTPDGLDIFAITILVIGLFVLVIGLLTFLSIYAPWILAVMSILAFIWAGIRIWRR